MSDLELHKTISYIKSAIRIVGFVLLPTSMFFGVALLVFAETLGILEEVVV